MLYYLFFNAELSCMKGENARIFERDIIMDTAKTLHSMREGTSARVTELRVEGGMRRRLQDMGLIEGTSVVCLQRSPSGDPIAYLIRGAVIALREEDSSMVFVS